ncbi:MAG: hypothetical protein JSS66_06475 [Armatimonadetes bacterium]|nr:hypothetical protein [Armatimonadota bacterium]
MRKKRTRESCTVVDQHCLAPAGYGVGGRCGANDRLPRTLPICDDCGQPVCRNCSFVRNKTRRCRNCFIDKFGTNAKVTVIARIYRLAGYDNSRAIAKREVAEEARDQGCSACGRAG